MSTEYASSEITVENNRGVALTRIRVEEETCNGNLVDRQVTIEPFHLSLDAESTERFLVRLERLIQGNAG